MRRLPAAVMALGATAATLRVLTEVRVLSHGAPGSASAFTEWWISWYGPMLGVGLMLLAVAGTPALLLLAWRWRDERRDLVHTAGALFAAGLLAWGIEQAIAPLRIWRLSVALERIDPAVRDYVARREQDSTLPVPTLGVRGCTDLEAMPAAWPPPEVAGGWQLQAECSRGLGSWDQLVLRPGAPVDARANVTRIGQWAYWWD